MNTHLEVKLLYKYPWQMHEMIDTIEGAFKNILSSLSWMDHDTRKVAKEKVSSLFTFCY